MEKLKKIQSELIASKNKKNEFGKYNYRNVEAVLSELKPILDKYNCHLKINNELIELGGRLFIKTNATFIDIENNYEETSTAFAAIDFEHKGMSLDQCTGAATTYCNKYCLNNLFLIDDGSNDPDSQKPKDYDDNDNQNNNFTVQNNNVQVDDIRKAETIEELTEFYNRIQNMKSEKAKTFLTNELTKRKNTLLGKQQ